MGSSSYLCNGMDGLSTGDHVCCLYETEEEHRTFVTSFLRKGIERGEKVIYVVDSHIAETILDYLRDDGLKVDSYLSSGQLIILSADEVYVKRGVFDPNEMVSLLRTETERALNEGYSALRVTGEMSWTLKGLPGSERLIEYESKLNEFSTGGKCLTLCQYDRRLFRRRVDSSLILDVLSVHPTVALGTEVYHNLYYIPPVESLGQNRSSTILNRWLENLKVQKQMEEVLQRTYDELETRVQERTAELSWVNVVLRDEVAERKKAEGALRESEERYKNLFENVPIGIYRTTPDGRILMANPALVKMLGYSSFEDLASCNLESKEWFGPTYLRSRFKELVEREGEVKGLESIWSRYDGSHIFVRENARAVKDEGGRVLYYEGTVEDITERERAEEALQKSLDQLSKKNRYDVIKSAVAQSVHQSINLQDVLENAVDAMSKNIDGVDNVSIYMVEGEEAVLKAFRGYSDWFIQQVGRIPYPRGFTWKTIIDGQPRYCPDVDQDTVIGPAGRKIGTQSYAAMPIHFQGKTIGAININSLKKNAFSQEELKLLEIVARQIEIAINNAQQAEALRQSEERYRTLFDQSPVGVYIFNRDYKITQCNERMVEILQSSYDKIMGVDLRKLRNQCVQPLIEKVFEGQSADYEGLYKATNSSAKLWVSIHLSPLRDTAGNVIGGMAVVEDISKRKRAEEALQQSKEELELRVRERTQKLYEINEELKKEISWRKKADEEIKQLNINLESRAAQLEATNKELEREILIRRQAEEALRESFAQLSKKSRYEKIVSTITRGVHQSINLQEVLENAVDTMNTNIDRANIVAIYLVEGREAVLKVHRGFPDWVLKRIGRIPNPKGFTWKTIIEGKPIYCPDVDKDTVIGPAGKEAGIKSYLCMPVRYEGKTVGGLSVSSFEKNAFDEEELQLLGTVARQIEIAINNAGQAEALRESEERYRALYEDNPSMYLTIDAEGKILSINRFGAEQLGFTPKELIGQSVLNIFYPHDREGVQKQLDECIKNIGEIVNREFRKVRKDESVFWVRESARAVRDTDGRTVVLIVCEEITKRKQAEEQIKSSLKEKEVLLKEVQHRVKNNLQVISSLIDLQTERLKDKRVINMFRETQSRVRSMALIHEQLYHSKNLAKVDFAEYVKNLGEYLFQSYGVKSGEVELKVNVDSVLMDVATAIPCGLIINELVSNSLKYAFPKFGLYGGSGKPKGEIRIKLNSGYSKNNSKRHLYSLIVGDNGVGLPKDLDFRNTESLGLQLVNTLTNQLNGTMRLSRRRGTEFKITFGQ
ncbi:MAG TPA: PAS domain S-box protein [Thermodesulfobacteriota bacterium]|nr:PAS domain S-box protein [Thermodesulfobacteriota bacterium]